MHAAINTTPNSIRNRVGACRQIEANANLTRSKPSKDPAVPGTTGTYPTKAPLATNVMKLRAIRVADGTLPSTEVDECGMRSATSYIEEGVIMRCHHVAADR